ncbi:hypothetical protein BU15DRAFT_49853 [Melanogaster broomeanus]|nr:hypothetical protein BU15DRAFT_49853 [Melanogaster broomeanus]
MDATSGNSTISESATDLLSDRIDLMAATTVLGVAYGIMTSLYFTTTYFLLKKLFRNNSRSHNPHSEPMSRNEWCKTLFYLAYTSVLFILATLYTAGNSQNAIVAYVDNRLFPGGPYQYYVGYMAGQTVMVMTDITSLMILWLTDALILWRFIVFYHKLPYARWIIPLPCAMYVGVVGEVESPYMNLATILVESAALYGVWSFVFLILCVEGSPGQTIILATMSQIQVIAPLLIILWITRGRAWGSHSRAVTPDPLPRGGMSRLSFGSRPVRPADDFDFVDSATSRTGSRSIVGGGDELCVNLVELRPCAPGSGPSSITDVEGCKEYGKEGLVREGEK